MTNAKLIDHLEKVAGKDAVEEAKKDFRGSVPRVTDNRREFIEKILATVKKESVSLGKQLRMHLRNGVKMKPILEGIDNKVDYLKGLLRKR